MSGEAVRERLFQLIKDEFNISGVAVFYEGQKKVEPKDAPWLLVTLQEGQIERANIGNPSQFKSYGVLNVQIMNPEDRGSKALRQCGDRLFEIVADRQLAIAGGSVTLCRVEKRNRPVINGWNTMNVMAEWQSRFSIDRAPFLPASSGPESAPASAGNHILLEDGASSLLAENSDFLILE